MITRLRSFFARRARLPQGARHGEVTEVRSPQPDPVTSMWGTALADATVAIVDGVPTVTTAAGVYSRHGHSWVFAPLGDRRQLVDVRWRELCDLLDGEARFVERVQAADRLLVRAFGGAA